MSRSVEVSECNNLIQLCRNISKLNTVARKRLEKLTGGGVSFPKTYVVFKSNRTDGISEARPSK